MSVLAIARAVAILVGLAWKIHHLARRPDDWSLRAVVACLTFFALSLPLRAFGPALTDVLAVKPPILAGLEYSLLMCAISCITVFFAGRNRPGGLRRYLIRHGTVLVVALVATLTFAALTSTDVGPRDYSDRTAAAMYLSAEIYIGAALVSATRHAARIARSPDAGSTQARGLLVTTLGLTTLALATLLLCLVQISTILGLSFPRELSRLGGLGLLLGAPVFVVGICYPGAVMRFRGMRLWTRRLREYRSMEPLWEVITQKFPSQRLRRAGPGAYWARALPRDVHRRHRRRRVEIRDGLVRMSPHIPAGLLPDLDGHGDAADADLRSLARWIVQHRVPAPPEDGGLAKPVLVPTDDSPENDIRALIRLSDAVRAELRDGEPGDLRPAGASW